MELLFMLIGIFLLIVSLLLFYSAPFVDSSNDNATEILMFFLGLLIVYLAYSLIFIFKN